MPNQHSDGDAPEQISKELASFLQKIERIYRRGLDEWTGDLSHDFPAIGMLMQDFVNEHSKQTGGKVKKIWVSRKDQGKGPAK